MRRTRPSPVRLGIPEGVVSWPVRVTATNTTVLAEGEEPSVKIHYGRLGRFVARADLPPFEGVEAWFRIAIKAGRFYFGDQVAAPEKRSHF